MAAEEKKIVSFEEPKYKKLKRLKTVGFVVGILLLCVAAGWGLRAFQNRNVADAPIQKPKAQLPQKVDNIQNLRLQGKNEESAKALDDALADTTIPKEERYQLYVQKGSLLSDQKKYPDAVEAYKQAAQVNNTYNINLLIAETYVQAGDKPKAVDYFKKAISVMPDGPMANADRARLTERIKALGGTV